MSSDSTSPATLRGIDYLKSPGLNKGMGFSIEERQLLGIHGLLPPAVKTQDEMVKQTRDYMGTLPNDLAKYCFLADLQENNERLFYRMLHDFTEEMMPLVYTPTVGLACQKFGLIYQRPRGLFISIHDAGNVYSVLKNWPEQDVRAICVTDGERILGLGDLGVCGMGIPVGKLSLYTALAGIKPHQLLPITLDVGTNNKEFLKDPNYIGLRQERVTGKQYEDFIDEFMQAVVKRYGQNCLIQFEDFANHNAFVLLDKYRDKYCTFNDDIQGTASVGLAGIVAALRLTKVPMKDNVFLFLGAGEAATGIAFLIVRDLIRQGLTHEEAVKRIWLCDSKGLVVKSRSGLTDVKKIFAKDTNPIDSFLDIVNFAKPTTIIGASAQAGAFNKEILRTMGQLHQHPIIFALSNPTSKAECTAEQAYTHTEGRAIFASGSPFPPFEYKGKTLYPGQGNNAYIFPGVALGIICAGIKHIGDDVFLEAAYKLASLMDEADLKAGRLYPDISKIYATSIDIAVAVVEKAYLGGYASTYPEPANKAAFVKAQLYDFSYKRSIPKTWSLPGSKSHA